MYELPQITVAGTPAEMGRAYGAACAPLIRDFVKERFRAARAYLWQLGRRDVDALVTAGRACLDLLEGWDEPAWVEHRATATAAGVDPVELYVAGNYTDVRDVVAYAERRGAAEAEGCTTALVPAAHSRTGELLAAQTWDLNPEDLDYVVAVHRRPADGPATWSVTVAGCPTLVGMNEHGLCVGTTNIKVRGTRPGIPYLSLLHRAVRARTHGAALDLIAAAPRAAAHTYWAADAAGAADLECSATACARRTAVGPLTRTNHCLDAGIGAGEAEPSYASSLKRVARARAWLAERPQDVASLKALFADRSDGIDSINRYAEDGTGSATDACIICRPAARELHACRGPADRGAWVRLGF